MSDEHQPATLVGDGLRKRAAQLPTEDAKETVESLNASEEEPPQAGKEKKTYGRTPDGSVFVVPYTHDMVSQLLSPTEPKNLSDIAVLAVLGSLFILLYVLPPAYRIPVFAVIFLFWRACYNVGIGILLRVQSNHRMLVSWAKKSHIFENPATGKNPRPWLYALLKREMETKIRKDYRFEEAPIEYNTWLLFRRVVDLILMCDFVSYCLFAVACSQRPEGENLPVAVLRWIFGLGLVGFNLWVKLDAHRVVKDYAWYWGDFFYLIDQELTFDGVFEMAPHPMYTVGYAGFYGISLMAGSYKVLFISIIAHAAQLAFLVFIENPHIDKTYNPPPRRQAADSTSDLLPIGSTDSLEELSMEDPTALSLATADQPSPVHKLLGLNNFDFCRVIDVAVLLLQCYTFFLTVLTPSTLPYQVMFFVNALVWRLWYSIGIGYILSIQSQRKGWTRHFLKYAESTEEAWRQWKGIYHISMTMCYGSFIAFAYKVYSLPDDWDTGLVLLKHVLGASLIALQVWTAFSIHESLGEFGWFFGDFFFDRASKLTYSGIYRYLNNPERVIGLAGVWGAVLITWNSAIFFLALISHASALWFMNFVEKPHMQKVYGQELREESGLVRSIKRSLPPPLKKWSRNVDKVFMETTDFVEDFITSARPKFAAGVRSLAKDTGALFSQYPARLTVTRIAPDLAGYDPKDYSIEVEGTPISSSALAERITGKEGEQAQRPPERRSNFRTLTFQYGAPIRVKWTAPLNHSKKDWVGLYMVADNASREVTKVSSLGRWVATNPHEYDSTTPDKGIVTSDVRVTRAPGSDDGESKDYLSGEMVFEGDKLFWTQGVFELRYHHDGKHSVMAISLPFEIRIGRFDEDDVEVDDNGSVKGAVEKALLPVVQHCFDRDPDIAPRTVDEAYGALIEREGKFAKRVVYAVHQMFGIEFAPEVVQADGTVKNLAWRICNAKKVLAPYSMSPSRGSTTPVSAKY